MRRCSASEASKESDTSVRRRNCGKSDGVAYPSPKNDEFGNVRWPGMADQGVGGPVSDNVILKPCVTDLGSDSDATTEEEESEDSDNEDPRFDSNASLNVGSVGKDSDLAVDGQAVLPAGSVVSGAIQAPTNVTTYGNIHLNKSSGIHIGNKTVYQGPVTIQQYVVKPGDESLQGKACPLAITDGSETGIAVQIAGSTSLKRTGLSSGSFRIGAGAVAASKGSGLLWRHLLGRRPGPANLAAWIALSVGCMIVVAVVLAMVYIFGRKEHPSILPASDADSEADEVNNAYLSPAKQQSKKKKKKECLLSQSWVLPRSVWGAAPPKEITPIRHPVPYVIISHTASEPCYSVSDCSIHIRIMQKYHVESRKWADLGYNFLVGGDGNAYEARGWDRVGAHSRGLNDLGMGISFIGTFIDVLPPPAQIRACKMLIEEGVRLGKIAPDYKLLGHRQVSPTESPGQMLYEELQKWEHWSPEI